MANPSLPQSAETPQTYTIKEFQLLVRDKPAIPAEILPFVGAPFTCRLGEADGPDRERTQDSLPARSRWYRLGPGP